MRKVIAATFLSLDGVMQAPGGPQEDTDGGFAFGGWTFHYWDEMMGGMMGEAMGKPFDLLLGRKTYDIFAAHWPRVPQDDPIGQKFNAITKYVATSSPDTLAWRNSAWLGEDAAAGVARLRDEDGPDLLVQGSSRLIQALLKADLIDEYRLWIFPVVLGGGKRMFGEGSLSGAMKLVDSKASTTGVVISTYVRDGGVRQGSFALE
jgi:dihydrofolate reductase